MSGHPHYGRTLVEKIGAAVLVPLFGAYALANFLGAAMLFTGFAPAAPADIHPGVELLLMGFISSWIAWAIWRL